MFTLLIRQYGPEPVASSPATERSIQTENDDDLLIGDTAGNVTTTTTAKQRETSGKRDPQQATGAADQCTDQDNQISKETTPQFKSHESLVSLTNSGPSASSFLSHSIEIDHQNNIISTKKEADGEQLQSEK